MAKIKEETLRLSECTMDYISFGNGEKPLIMISGLSLRRVKGSGRGVALSYRIFAKDYRVYMFDTRNECDESCSITQMADDLYEAMCALRIEQADLLGVSMGGMILQTLLIRHPKIIDHCVIALSASYCAEISEKRIGEWIRLSEQKETDLLVRGFFNDLYSESYLKRYKPFMGLLVKMASKADPVRFMNHAKAILKFDVRDQLSNVQTKAYVIGAKQDRIVPWQETVNIAAKLKAPYYLYENLGHGAYEEAKDFNERVLKALKGEADG